MILTMYVEERIGKKHSYQKKKELYDLKKEVMKAKQQAVKNSFMKATYYKKKLIEVAEQGCQKCRELEDELVQLKDKNAELHDINAALQEQIEVQQKEECDDQSDVVTYKGGRYTDQIRECIIRLLTLNVGINNVNDIIECVMKLNGKRCSKLPSRSKINDLLIEARAISHLQLAHLQLICSIDSISSSVYFICTIKGSTQGSACPLQRQ